LKSHHPTGGKASAITDAVHFILNVRVRITGTQKISVHGMGQPVFHRPVSRHHGLANHLASKHVLKAQVFTASPEMVPAHLFHVQQVQQPLHNVLHESSSSPIVRRHSAISVQAYAS